MNDFRPTNEKIAELLQQQTYDERMEMGAWFRDTLNDQMADLKPDAGFETGSIARLFSAWAEGELEVVEDAP